MLVLLAALGSFGVLPIVGLASHSSRRAWIFAGAAVAFERPSRFGYAAG